MRHVFRLYPSPTIIRLEMNKINVENELCGGQEYFPVQAQMAV
jgi:hypothetical protein